MGKTPLVSLLVPIYNVECYLEECLESARKQTLKDIEVICINDGSTDGSREIIQKYLDLDPRFKVIDKENSGYGASMNMGLDAAAGTYIGILESDDFFELDALEKLYNAAEKRQAQVAKANFWFYWSVPKKRDELFRLVTRDMADRVVDTSTKEPEILYAKPSIWSAIYRADFLRENGIRFLETPGASFQDSAFTFKVWACATRVVFLTVPILHYRQDNETSSVNSPKKVYCICDEHAEMDRFLDAHPEKSALRPVKELMKYDNYMWNYERLAEPLQAEFIKRFSEEFRADTKKGYVDLDLFDPWKREGVIAIMEDPDAYHLRRMTGERDGLLAKVQVQLKYGGVPSLLRAVLSKFRRR